jgi:hypothetical protein
MVMVTKEVAALLNISTQKFNLLYSRGLIPVAGEAQRCPGGSTLAFDRELMLHFIATKPAFPDMRMNGGNKGNTAEVRKKRASCLPRPIELNEMIVNFLQPARLNRLVTIENLR